MPASQGHNLESSRRAGAGGEGEVGVAGRSHWCYSKYCI